jgi:chromosome segregation ATPase
MNNNGVIYYKLNELYDGDFTKYCGLTGSEVDSNIHFLRGSDIDKIYWDAETEILYFEYVNGKIVKIEGINAIAPTGETVKMMLEMLYEDRANIESLLAQSKELSIKLNEEIENRQKDVEDIISSITSINTEIKTINEDIIPSLDANITTVSSNLTSEIENRIRAEKLINDEIKRNKVISFTSPLGTLNTGLTQNSNGTFLNNDVKLSQESEFLAITGDGITDKGIKSHVKTEINSINNSLSALITTEQNLREKSDNAISERITKFESDTTDKFKVITTSVTSVNNNINSNYTSLNDKINDVKIELKNDITIEVNERKGEDASIKTVLNNVQKTVNTNRENIERSLENEKNTLNNLIVDEKNRAITEETIIKTNLGEAYPGKSFRVKLDDVIFNNEQEFKSVNEKITKNKTDIKTVTDKLNLFLSDAEEGAKAIDTLKELQDYINTHGQQASGLLNSINEVRTIANQAQSEVDELEIKVSYNKQITDNDIKELDYELGNRIATLEKDYLKSADKTEIINFLNKEMVDRQNADATIITNFQSADVLIKTDLENFKTNYSNNDKKIKEDITSLFNEIKRVDGTILSNKETLEESIETLEDNTSKTINDLNLSLTETINDFKTSTTISLNDLTNKDTELSNRVEILEVINHSAYIEADEELENRIKEYVDEKNETLNASIEETNGNITILDKKIDDNQTNINVEIKGVEERITSNTKLIQDYVSTVNTVLNNINTEIENIKTNFENTQSENLVKFNELSERVTNIEEFLKTVVTFANVYEHAVTNLISEDKYLALDNEKGDIKMNLNDIINTTF